MKIFYCINNFQLPILVDDIDWERVAKHRWRLDERHRVKNSTNSIYLSRFILGITDPKILVDHINRDSRDNRRENLRIATKSQNTANSGPRKGKYKGIFFYEKDQNWLVTICVNYKQIYIGRFKTEIEAARAYDKAAKQYFGEFAYLNFPKEDE